VYKKRFHFELSFLKSLCGSRFLPQSIMNMPCELRSRIVVIDKKHA
jgi:hypothetical protein